MIDDARGKSTDELEKVELVVDLTGEEEAEEPEGSGDRKEPPAEAPPREIRLSREQTLADLRDLQELTVERADGRSPSED